MEKNAKLNIDRMLLPLVLGMLLCAICLVGGTYAWFTGNQQVTALPIEAASYQVEAQILDEQGLAPAYDGQSHTLEAGKLYQVKLTAQGTASTGYAIVSLGEDTKLITAQIAQGEMLEFILQCGEETSAQIAGSWGTSSKFEQPDIEQGSEITLGTILPVCGCAQLCTGETGDPECPLCSQDMTACQGEAAQPADDPDSENTEPEDTQPEITQPEITQPEVTQPEVTQPEDTQPEITQPEDTQPEATQPEDTQPEVTQPEVTQPEVTQPEVTQPEDTQPEVTQPEATQPEVTQPEVTQPEDTQPEDTQPETTQEAETAQ